MTSRLVFIVEDDPDLAEFYINALQLYGHVIVDHAKNGAEAVALFANMSKKPDVIIMDHRMPMKTGLEAMREIMAMDPGARIIFASADPNTETEARKLGACSFKKKPFSLDRLIANVEKA